MRRIFVCAALTAIALVLTGQLVGQSRNASKQTGPEVSSNLYYNNWGSGGGDYVSGYIVLWPTGSKQNPGFTLLYQFYGSFCSYSNECYNINESFNGPIPAGSITYSGQPKWNGSFHIVLDVDTSLIPSGENVTKTGVGGHIALTWNQNPTSAVRTQTGTITIEDLSGRLRNNGWTATIDGTATGSVWLLPWVTWNDPMGSMEWIQFTGVN